ncbi:hypothetical protein FS749_004365 [Ceratobasidium sp. UAMH 11750]|nr:hypothetical protein FS749_004365 [Ceratobasidium sp. UAMH 11750]
MSLRTHKGVFAIPELVKLVCVYLDLSDSARVACSNNQLFRIVMPSVWEYVNGVSQLLALLPASNNENETKNGGQMAEKPLTENDLSRLNIYAPWIKHLEVCRTRKSRLILQELDGLCRYATAHVLLPNLQSITCTNAEGFVDVTWVLPFLSSSLISLEFVIASFGGLPELSPSESLILLHAIATKCPKLQTLSMVVDPDEDSPELHAIEYLPDDERMKIEEHIPLGLGSFVASVRPLVNLTFSAEILNPACFRTIGTWPSLESLVITMDPEKSDYTLPQLDHDSFPALRHLGLFWIPDMATFRRVWTAPALIRKLTSVKLLPSPDFCSRLVHLSDIVELFSILAKNSPSLQGLWLRMTHPAVNGPVYYDVPLTVVAPLQELPLETLYIEGIQFSDYLFYFIRGVYSTEYVTKRNAFIKHFATSFPALRELGFPLHRISLTDLSEFHSQMPQLESLSFDFDLGFLPRGHIVNLGNIPRYRRSPFRTLEVYFPSGDQDRFGMDAEFQYDEAVRLVNYLFSLWPNVQITAQPDEEEFEDRTPRHRKVALINEQLAALSCCNHDPSIKYEDVKILNEYSWAKCVYMF